MNFFNLALSNIRQKFGSYLIYLVSAVFAVTIFSIFCSMYFNPQFSGYRFGAGKMAALFQISAVAVIVFASVFILYANKFFVKTRKKEIAIYSLLGMRKSQIGRLLFYENIFIGIIAIAGGIILGTLFSRLFSMIMLNLMKQIPRVDSSIQWEAIVVTAVVFSIIFILNSLFAYTIIYRYKLIELMSASKEGEKMPRYFVLAGVLSLILLASGYAYGLSIDFNQGAMKKLPDAFWVIILVVSGTLLLFDNFVPMLVVRLKQNKKLYYKSTNFISLSQIVYRIRANSRMLSIIAVLSAITVTMISATVILYMTFEDMAGYYTPFSFLSSDVTEEQYKKVVAAIDETGEVKLLSTNRFTLINATCRNPRYAKVYDKQPGETLTKVDQPGDPFDAYIISSGDYKKIISNLNVETGKLDNLRTDFNMELKDNECYFIDGNMDTTYSKDLWGDVNFDAPDTTRSFKIVGISMHKYLGIFKDMRKTTIVVNDNVYETFLKRAGKSQTASYMGLMFDHPMNSKNTVTAINQIVPANKDTMDAIRIKNLNYYELTGTLYTQYGAYLFIGTFLGILFLLASGSIMYYKQIIEAQEEVGRYEILRKTGMNQGEVKRSISKQLAVVFGMPLVIGLMHSVVALVTYNNVMMFVAEQVYWAYAWEAVICVIYMMIYYFYYRLSVNSYMKIVWKG